MEIGKQIKSARESIGMTQESASEAIGVSRQTISNWETGRTLPDIISVIKMSDLYNISLDDLLKGDETMMKKIESDAEYVKKTKKAGRAGKLFLITLCAIAAVTAVINFGFREYRDTWNNAATWIILGVFFVFFSYWQSVDPKNDDGKSCSGDDDNKDNSSCNGDSNYNSSGDSDTSGNRSGDSNTARDTF